MSDIADNPSELGVAEAKKRFSELIDRVGEGEKVIISRHGKPVLKLSRPLASDNGAQKPLGLASAAGALSEWEELDRVVEELYEARKHATDRPVGPLTDS